MAWIRACGGGSPAIPDGKTVTPINDVTIWQQCAGIANPTYTTLAEVLADTGILQTLMASDNAVDYLVRSKSFAKQEALVPTMTSNNTPSGIASATASNSDAWLMFDGDDSTYWDATGAFVEATVFYEFDTKKRIGSFAYMGFAINNTANSVSIVNSDGTELFATNLGNVATLQNVSLSSVSVGTKFGLKFKSMYNSGGSNHSASGKTLQFYSELGVTENPNAMQYIGANNYCANTLLADSDWRDAICNSAYFESVLNFKNPAMSSNTSPTGYVASASSQLDSTYFAAYKAFDNDDTTGWLATGKLSENLTLQLPTTHKMYRAFVKPYKDAKGTHVGDFNIVGSTDGVNWSYNLASDQFTNNAPYEKMVEIYDGNEYSYYRINILNSPANEAIGMFTVIFYGREDV